jgi:hypothetical protein
VKTDFQSRLDLKKPSAPQQTMPSAVCFVFFFRDLNRAKMTAKLRGGFLLKRFFQRLLMGYDQRG